MKQILTYEYQCTDFVFAVLFRCELMAVSLGMHCMFWCFPLRVFLKWILLLFQLNVHMLNTYIYQQLLSTCLGVCNTIFRETIALLAQILYATCGVVT